MVMVYFILHNVVCYKKNVSHSPVFFLINQMNHVVKLQFLQAVENSHGTNLLEFGIKKVLYFTILLVFILL